MIRLSLVLGWFYALSAAAVVRGEDSLFTRLDKNADGQVVADEIAAEHQRLFARLVAGADEDGDGALTSAEFAAGLAPDRPEKLVESNQAGGQPGMQAVRLMLLKLDANRDSRLSKTEAPADLKYVFMQLAELVDANKDDVLERFELGRVGPQMGRVAVRAAVQNRWDIPSELAAIEKEQGAAAKRFDQPYEPQELLRDPAKAGELFALLDADGDGKITKAELPEQLAERIGPLLTRSDSNRDGAVSRAEFRTASERRARFMSGPGAKFLGDGTSQTRRQRKRPAK